jgi:hypothetical protein
MLPSFEGDTMAREQWRRAVLVVGCVGAVVAATWVHLGPVVEVERWDSSVAKSRLLGGFLPTDRERALAGLPDAELVAEVTRGRLIEAESGDWEAVLSGLPAAGEVAIERQGRLPLGEAAELLAEDGDEAFVRVTVGGDEVELVHLTRRDVSLDDFNLGSGWSGGRRPPDRVLYPARWLAPWLLAIGLVGYAVIPWPRRVPSEVRLARWKVVLSDAVGLMLLLAFGTLPVFIVGSAFQNLLVFWPIPFFLWLMAAGGVWILVQSAWWAQLSLLVSETEITIRSVGGSRRVVLDDVVARRLAVLRLPAWLRALQWIAAAVAPAGRSAGSAGTALLFSGALSVGTELILRDERRVFLWQTSPSGGSVLVGAGLLNDVVERIPEEEEPRVVESLTMPVWEGFEADRPVIPWKMLVTGCAVLVAAGAALVVVLSDGSEGTRKDGATPGSLETSVPGARWEYRFERTGFSCEARLLQEVEDGLVVVVQVGAGGSDVDMVVVRLDASGVEQWRAELGGDDWDLPRALAVGGDGALYVGGITRGTAIGRLDPSLYLARVDLDTAAVTWQRRYGWDGRVDSAMAVMARPGGGARALGRSDGVLALLEVDASGQQLRLERIDGVLDGDREQLGGALWMADGGAVVHGSVDFGEGQDAVVVRLDKRLRMAWKERLEVRGLEWITHAAVAPDGATVVVGSSHTLLDDTEDLWVALLADDGAVRWRRQLGAPEVTERGVAVAVDERSVGWVVASVVPGDGGTTGGWLVAFGPDGDEVGSQELVAPAVGYHPASAAFTVDRAIVVGGTRQLPGYLVSSAFVVAVAGGR